MIATATGSSPTNWKRSAATSGDPAVDATAAVSLIALYKARPALAADLEEADRAYTHQEHERERRSPAVATALSQRDRCRISPDQIVKCRYSTLVVRRAMSLS